MIGRQAAVWSANWSTVVVAIWILLEWHQFMEPMFPAILSTMYTLFPQHLYYVVICYQHTYNWIVFQLTTTQHCYNLSPRAFGTNTSVSDNMLWAVSSMTTITCHNVGVGFPTSSQFMLGMWIFHELNDVFFSFLVVVDNWPVATDSWEISTEREHCHWYHVLKPSFGWFFEFWKNCWFRFCKYFRIKEPLVSVLWKKFETVLMVLSPVLWLFHILVVILPKFCSLNFWELMGICACARSGW
jgi:hypothetical protein